MNKKVVFTSILSFSILGAGLYYITGKEQNPIAYAASDSSVSTQKNYVDKADIQNLMLNSIDYFKTAEGEFEYFSSSGEFNLQVSYQVDLSDSPKSYEKVQSIDSKTKSLQDGYEESIYDGDSLINYNSGSTDYMTNGITKQETPELYSIEVGQVREEEKDELKNSTIEQRIISKEGEKNYIHRIDPSYMGITKTSLFPEDIAMGFFEDTDWDIVGEESVVGVNSVVIEGKMNTDYSSRYDAETFRLNIEPNTGIMLQMKVFDETGEVKESIIPKSIAINKGLDGSDFYKYSK